jgi:hypothetical protein
MVRTKLVTVEGEERSGTQLMDVIDGTSNHENGTVTINILLTYHQLLCVRQYAQAC